MHIIFIGGNAAGMSAAAKAQRSLKDGKITVYEQGEIVAFGSCGLPYYVADYFDDSPRMIARTPEAFIESGINLKLKHRVVALDVSKKEVSVENDQGETFVDHYDKLVITSGASPVVPPFPGKDLKNIFSLRELADGDAIKAAIGHTGENAVIVGGGFIGLELAEALEKQGKKVRIIELENRIMKAFLDEDFSTVVENELRTKGVQLCLGEKVLKFTGSDSVQFVETDKATYPADLVVLSIGVRPNTGFLKGSGIKQLGNSAIIVDNRGESSIKDIYSAGDCAAVEHMISKKAVYSPLGTTANKLGRIIGESLSGGTKVYPGTLSSSCVKVFDMEAGRTGYSSGEIELLKLETSSVLVKDKNQTDYYPGQEEILLKVTYMKDSRKIISAQCAGRNGAVLRINALAVAIQKEMSIDELAMADFCYSPPFSRTWDVMNRAGNIAR